VCACVCRGRRLASRVSRRKKLDILLGWEMCVADSKEERREQERAERAEREMEQARRELEAREQEMEVG
jgi:hypothetical protein